MRRASSRRSRASASASARSWASTYDTGPIADRLNDTRKHVASTTLERVESNKSALITGDVAEHVAQLKRQDGPEVQGHGSSGLIQTLLKHDLVDEFRMWIFPVVIGSGKRFFGDGTIPVAMKLVDSNVSSTGVTINPTNARATSSPGRRNSTSRPRRRSKRRGRLRGRSPRNSQQRATCHVRGQLAPSEGDK